MACCLQGQEKERNLGLCIMKPYTCIKTYRFEMGSKVKSISLAIKENNPKFYFGGIL